MVTGVGGTGVVTIGALITMAAHLEGKSASVLDFMGFAQKGGAVLSFVRFANTPQALNQVRIDTQQADVLLACDMVVGASADALQTVRRDRTRVVVNTHAIPNATFVQNPDASLHADALLAKMRHAAGNGKLDTCDAQALAQRFLGDTMGSNIIMLGYAWQLGLVPVSLHALQRAIELNNVAVPMNQLALAIGRLAAGDPSALTETTAKAAHAPMHAPVADDMTFDALVAHRVELLTQYQSAAYAAQFTAFVKQVVDAETRVAGAPGRLSRAVAQQLSRLMAYKDEYEVARLYAQSAFADALGEAFECKPGRDFRLEFHMAPPLIARGKDGAVPKKVTIGPWLWPVLRGMAKLRGLRGGALDVFGYTLERRMERQLIADYRTTIERALAGLTADTLADAVALAEVPAKIRGYGHVKLANLAMAKRVEATIAARLGVTPATGDAVEQALAHARHTGKSLKGIPVVTAR